MNNYGSHNEGRDLNYWEYDPILQNEIQRVYEDGLNYARKKFSRYGELLGHEIADNSDIIDENPPKLHTHDRDGNLTNEVEYHPAQIENERLTFEHGVVADSFRPPNDRDESMPLLHSLGMYYLMCYCDIGLACAVSMTGGAALVLDQHDDGTLYRYLDALTERDYNNVKQGAMFLTEKQGGSDVGANETTAEPTDKDGVYRLTGEKWFCSNIDAQAPLVLARTPGAPEGTEGLSLFLVPPDTDGEPNGVEFRRLKDKLGTKSVPTGEVELDGAKGYLVGEEESGFKYMSTMLNYERVTNALGSSGIMARALLEAKIHAANREAFDKPLEDHPLMRRDLVDMQVDHEAATAFSFEAAHALTRYVEEDEGFGLMRVLIPVAKLRTARMAVETTSYSMEILGGNGYVEDWVTHRLLRDAQVSPIWEGASNIMALETLKGLQVAGAHRDVLNRIDEYLDVTHPYLQDLAEEVQKHRDALENSFGELVSRGRDYAELQAKETANMIFDVYTSALLIHEAAQQIEEGNARKALVAEHFINNYLNREEDHGIPSGDTIPLDYYDAVVKHASVDPNELVEPATQE